MNTSPVTLAELARATEDLPFEENDNDKNDGTPAALMTRPAEERLPPATCHLPPSAEPSEADIATLTAQYRKAVNGLYEAYVFGQMLMAVKSRLEVPSPRSLTRETAMEQLQNGRGWNAGTGLKAWLAEHCPDINYKTAMRFLSIAENTRRALAAQAAEATNQPISESANQPSEAQVRAFLEGKSQRQVLKAPAKPTPRHAMSEEERAERIRETFAGFLTSLEGMVHTEETALLRPEDRRELVIRLKTLATNLDAIGKR